MPNRVLREGLLHSELISNLHDKTARLWLALFLSADDFGLVEIGFGPIKRAAPLFDWNRETVEKMLLELVDAPLIIPYSESGKRFAVMCKWAAKVNSSRPKHPPPPFGFEHIIQIYGYKDQKTRQESAKYIKHLSSASGTLDNSRLITSAEPVPEEVRGKREEVRGKREGQEQNLDLGITKTEVLGKTEVLSRVAEKLQHPQKSVATRIPKDWAMSPEFLEAGQAIFSGWEPEHFAAVADQFRDYWLAKAGKDALKVDWLATWRTWLRRETTRPTLPPIVQMAVDQRKVDANGQPLFL